MEPVDWEDTAVRPQRNLYSTYQRELRDMGVSAPYSFYSKAWVSDGEPLEDEGVLELKRKMNVLRDIEVQILHKKAAILRKTIEMSKKKTTPDLKGAPLRDRVAAILQQRHSFGLMSKCKTNWSPTENAESPNHITDQLEDHPLKLRVKALMRRRFCGPSESISNNSAVDHEMAAPPVTARSPSQSIGSPIQEENITNKGFERFLNLLNKGVDMDLLSKIVNDDSEELHFGDQSVNCQHSTVREDSDLATSSESPQCNSEPQNGGERTELSNNEHDARERHSLSDDDKNSKDKRDHSIDSDSGFKSPPAVEKIKKKNKEIMDFDERHEQLQNILKSLGLSLEMDDLTKLTDRTQERLYGKKNERMSVTPTATEQQSPVSTSESCKRDRRSSSSSSFSLTSSRSCSRSPSYKQPSPSKESQNRHKKDSFSARGGSRKSRETLSPLYVSQDETQTWKLYGENKDADVLDEPNLAHSHCDPAAVYVCPDYSLPHSSCYNSPYIRGTNSSWRSSAITSLHSPSSSPCSMDAYHSHYTIPSVKHNRLSVEDAFFMNPDLSTSEGQFGSISGHRNLQVVNMRQPSGHCLPQVRGNNRSLQLQEQGKTVRLKPGEEQDRHVQTSSAHRESEHPFGAKPTTALKKMLEPTCGQKDNSKKQPTPTEEQIKANLKKKLEEFNQMSKNKSHAQSNPYPQMYDIGL